MASGGIRNGKMDGRGYRQDVVIDIICGILAVIGIIYIATHAR